MTPVEVGHASAFIPELTQEDIDAMGAPEPTGLVVRDIPGSKTVAHSDDKAGWREWRGRTWSATTVTTIAGSNPFATVMDLWRERMLGIRPTFSAFSQKIMAYGTEAEPELLEHANAWVAAEAAKGKGDAAPFMLTHGYIVDDLESPEFGCTPDAWRNIVVDGIVRLELAEFKTGSKNWRKTPRSKPVVPANYVDQMLVQMFVTGARRVLAIQRVVVRDRQGNVTEVVGHNEVWVEWDQKRWDVLVAMVREYAEMERTGTAPMIHVDAEDQFDDDAETTAEKAAIRQALQDIAEADAELAKVQSWMDKGSAAKSRLKAILAQRNAKQVTTQAAGMGATLTRSNKTGYNVALLTEKQRERIRTTTPVETLRLNPLEGK